MKKSTKITLIAAVVLMLVGGITALICMVLGADYDELDLHFDTFLSREHHDSSHTDGDGAIMELDEDAQIWTYKSEEIHSLKLDVEAGSLYLEYGDAWQIAVSNGRDGLRCEVMNGVLTVEENDSIHTLLDWSGNHTPSIHVTIPEGAVLELIYVSVGAGNVEATDLRAKQLGVDVDAGSVSCLNLQVSDQCQIDVDAGCVSIGHGGITGDMQIEVDAGQVIYQGIILGDWQVDCDAGSVELELAGALSDYNYQIEYDLGSIWVGDREFSGMSDQTYLDHGASYLARIQCDVGQVTVSFNE